MPARRSSSKGSRVTACIRGDVKPGDKKDGTHSISALLVSLKDRQLLFDLEGGRGHTAGRVASKPNSNAAKKEHAKSRGRGGIPKEITQV